MPSSSLMSLAAATLHVKPSPERALEIGCGQGDGVLFLAREFPSARIRGVDPDASVVRAAAGDVGLDPDGRVAFKQGRPRSLPYPESFFDLVVQRQGLVFAREVARVLRPGGQLVYVSGGQERLTTRLEGALARAAFRRIGAEAIESGRVEGCTFYVCRLGGR